MSSNRFFPERRTPLDVIYGVQISRIGRISQRVGTSSRSTIGGGSSGVRLRAGEVGRNDDMGARGDQPQRKPKRYFRNIHHLHHHERAAYEEAYKRKQQQKQQKKEQQKLQRKQEQMRQQQAAAAEKAEDAKAEEFLNTIKDAVDTAVSMYAKILSRRFHKLSAKIDEFTAELKSINENCKKVKADVNEKVMHYDMENTRNCHYFYMKTECERMSHQSNAMMMSTNAMPSGMVMQPAMTMSMSMPMQYPQVPHGKRPMQIGFQVSPALHMPAGMSFQQRNPNLGSVATKKDQKVKKHKTTVRRQRAKGRPVAILSSSDSQSLNVDEKAIFAAILQFQKKFNKKNEATENEESLSMSSFNVDNRDQNQLPDYDSYDNTSDDGGDEKGENESD